MKTLTTEEKQELKKRFENILSIDDLVEVINYVHQELLAGDEISKDDVLSNADLSNKRYHTFSIRKKTGGERIINAPESSLEKIQKALNTILNECVTVHPKAMGFTKGKSVVTNARLHLGKNYVYNIDLKDFFHSFKKWQVKRVFARSPFQFSEEVANCLTNLCVYALAIDDKKEFVLPQGAPTSPILTNILCRKMDIALDKLAKKYKATYSRYADDISFSSNVSVFNNSVFLEELEAIISRNRLEINPKKTRLQKKNTRQEVTGITVNEKLNTTRKYVKQIRMWLYLIEKYGAKKAETIFRKDYAKEKGHTKLYQNPIRSVIGGKLLYLKMVKGAEDSTYLKLAQRFDKVCGFDADKILDTWQQKGEKEAQKLFEETKNNKWKNLATGRPKPKRQKLGKHLIANARTMEEQAEYVAQIRKNIAERQAKREAAMKKIRGE
ncbi:reverse transcriptase domain-containing protein [Capnocytophaga canimorsus]|uniref:reverse transcriptase domain-containing protein n=1 Tax=Capnocytophaga canimorsus TaxID=28188 RepID=UPI00385B1B44